MTIPSSLFDGLHHEPTPKRIRAVRNGRVVLDSTAVQLVWEHRRYPQFYVPRADVIATLEPATSPPAQPPQYHDRLGAPRLLDLVTDDGDRAEAVAWTHEGVEALRDHVRFRWDAVDQWLEEDEPVPGPHPRDPYTRVDCRRSSRTVRVEVDGTVVAESPRPTVLFETGLRARWYVPPTDVRLDLLEPSDTVTRCPYKGTASYHSLRIGGAHLDDLVWHYPTPTREATPIAGLLCFYDERVDLYVDGRRTA